MGGGFYDIDTTRESTERLDSGSVKAFYH